MGARGQGGKLGVGTGGLGGKLGVGIGGQAYCQLRMKEKAGVMKPPNTNLSIYMYMF